MTDDETAELHKAIARVWKALGISSYAGTGGREISEIVAGLRTLALDMGNVIRRLDDAGQHSEFWTNDDDYIIDGRFPK